MSMTRPQVEALLAPLHPGRVRQVQGNAHLEAWDVRRHLIRIFGWGGWDFEIVACDLVQQIDHPPAKEGAKPRYTVVYRALGRLTVRDPEGNVVGRWEDGATGDAANQPSLGDAHDMALKTALSQALKRCAMNLGDQFGLGLYNGGRTDAVVGRSLAYEVAGQEVDVTVHGGEVSAPQDDELLAKRDLVAVGKAAGLESTAALAEAFAEWSGGELLAEVGADRLRAFQAHLQGVAA